MPKCYECGTELVEGILNGGAGDLYFSVPGRVVTQYSTRVKAFICPECGWVRLAGSEPNPFKRLITKKE